MFCWFSYTVVSWLVLHWGWNLWAVLRKRAKEPQSTCESSCKPRVCVWITMEQILCQNKMQSHRWRIMKNITQMVLLSAVNIHINTFLVVIVKSLIKISTISAVAMKKQWANKKGCSFIWIKAPPGKWQFLQQCHLIHLFRQWLLFSVARLPCTDESEMQCNNNLQSHLQDLRQASLFIS